MFDTICKFLVENFSADFASWLLGEPIALTELSPSELSLEPIRADALLLFQSDRTILHIEFQTQPDPNIPFRMLDYRIRVYRRFPDKSMRQVVIYLQPTQSQLVQQNSFILRETQHRFEVIRLWEQPLEIFLNAPGLLPFAVLSRVRNQSEALQQVATQLKTIPDRRTQSNITAATAILAGLVLEKGLVQQILRRELMQESVIYQDILQEGRQEGIQQGLQQGIEQERFLIVRLLTRKVGEIPEEVRSQIAQLPLPQLENLGEALLDFSTYDDLVAWLERNPIEQPEQSKQSE